MDNPTPPRPVFLRQPGNFRDRAAFWIAVSGGAGLSPYWPGTAGATIGVIVAACLAASGPVPTGAILAGLFLAGTWAAGVVEREWRVEDPQFVVIDETFGAAATLCLLPIEPVWWIAGFAAFRVLDVIKPWPANLVHRRMTGGLAIMLDDAVAAGFSVAILTALAALTSGPG